MNRTANKAVTKYSKALQTFHFLSKCLDQNLIPVTFKVNTLPTRQLQEPLLQQWTSIQRETSQGFVKIALADATRILEERRRELEMKRPLPLDDPNWSLKISRAEFIATKNANKRLINIGGKIDGDKRVRVGVKERFSTNTTHTKNPPTSNPRTQMKTFSTNTTRTKNRTNNVEMLPTNTTRTKSPSGKTFSTNLTHTENRTVSEVMFSTSRTPTKDAPLTEKRCSSKSNKPNRHFVKRPKWHRKGLQLRKKGINLVFNYSNLTLTEGMTSLLNKGLNFCPAQKPKREETLCDFKYFARKIKWKEYWFGKETDEEWTPPIFPVQKSNLPRNTSKEVEGFLSGIKGELVGSQPNQIHDNLTREERTAFKILIEKQANKELIVKPADKGAGVCVLNYTDYVNLCENHLQEKTKDGYNYYRKSSECDLAQAREKITNILKIGLFEDFISNEEYKAMIPTEMGPGRLYLIPKVHKQHPPGELPPGRPIVSGCGSITENISKFVDFHAKALVRKLDTFVQDTPHFLRHIEDINKLGPLPSTAVPISIDVSALYTSIPQDEGVETFREALDEREDKSVPTEFIIALLERVLKDNIFEFNNQLYLQQHGTAMGTVAAVVFANLYMKKHDILLKKNADNTHKGALNRLLRYIDDYFAIWTGGKESFISFIDTINNQHPSIKFTWEADFDARSTNFLDTRVSIKNGKIITDLYRKPTDRCQYLLPSSCHPGHITDNVPFSLGLRLLRICSERSTLEMRLQELKNLLISRGYRPNSVDFAIQKVLKTERQTALIQKPKQDKNNERVVFAIKYHPHNKSIKEIVQRHYRALLQFDPLMEQIYKQPPMVAYKQPRNLKSFLCKAKLPEEPEDRTNWGLSSCNKARCQTCGKIIPGDKVVSKTTDKTIQVKSALTCESKWIVYCISCKKCNSQYVGETKRRLKDRFADHLRYARQGDQRCATGVHFSQNGHSTEDMTVQVLEQVKKKDKIHLLEREDHYIGLMGTRKAPGLNKNL